MNFDDPRLTAYALGELENAEDRAAVERLLQESPEARAEYEELKSFTATLGRELKAEPEAALTPDQRSDVLAVAHPTEGLNGRVVPFAPASGKAKSPWYRQHWLPVGIAAVALFVTTIAALWEHANYEQLPLKDSSTTAPVPMAAMLSDHESVRDDESKTSAPEVQSRAKDEAVPLLQRAQLADRQEPVAQTAPAPSTPALLARRVEVRRNLAPAAPAETSANLTPVAPAKAAFTSRVGTQQVREVAERGRMRSDGAVQAEDSAVMEFEPPQIPESFGADRNIAVSPTTPTFPIPAKRSASDAAIAVELQSEVSGANDRLWTLQKAWDQPVGRFGNPEATGTIQAESNFSLIPRLQPVSPQEHDTETYDAIQDNPFLTVQENPLSTFSIDVDTASYSNVRRFLTNGSRPPKGAVRIEEMVNYFPYDYPQPQGADPFSCTLEVATCPWEPQHRLVRVGLKGRDLPKEQRPASNLVFLIDVSGSMEPQNKLPLVKEALQQMIAELGPKDTVAIAVYAGASGTVLEPTSDRSAIRAALARLEAGGSTNGASGIQLAYDLAKRSFIKEGNNRVVLATDGDFNVGVTSRSELVDLIEKRAKEGVFLTVLGFGFGNLKDATLEQLADKGNGNYAYIDSIREGRKVLVEQMAGTLFTIAKDVKIQVEFNPAQVSAYRLIGYENRLLRKEDFNDDTKDAGEIGAGHTVTALYQVVPAGVAIKTTGVDELKYQPRSDAATPTPPAPASKEMLTLKLRYKQPDGDTSTLREFPLTDVGLTWERSSRDFRFAAAVASFGMLLRDSPHKGSATWDSTMELAVEGKGEDAGGYRQEFIGLLEKAKALR